MAVNVTQKDKTLNDVINWCEKLLGYSGSMPLEVPNQSEKE